MKKSAIVQVFNGFRGTAEQIQMNEAERKLMGDVSNLHNELLNELTPTQKELHEKFIEARESAFCESANSHYIEGFKTGLLIGIECMED